MNCFETKEMIFYGDVVKVAKDENGVIWIGMNSLIKALGLTDSQRASAYNQVYHDSVLKANRTLAVTGMSKRGLSYIALDYLPMWLTRIKPYNDRIAEKLATFQVIFRNEVLKQFPKAKGITYKKQFAIIEDRITHMEKNFEKLEQIVNAKLVGKEPVEVNVDRNHKTVDSIMVPLAKKRKDHSKGFSATCTAIYIKMRDKYNINWYSFYREYKNKNGADPHSKKELINNTPVLLEKFENVVNEMIAVA